MLVLLLVLNVGDYLQLTNSCSDQTKLALLSVVVAVIVRDDLVR